MVAPGLLQNPLVKNWLGGIEPVWTLLDQPSFDALRRPPSPAFGPIRLATDLVPEAVQRSAVARNAVLLMQSAANGPGLVLTATGNLSRAVVAEMVDRFEWPDFDKADAFRLHKVVNEPDFLPLFFVRHVVEAARLLRRYKGHLKITPAGRRMLQEPQHCALQALLFHVALWHLDLGYLGRGLHEGWPQRDVGIVLWSLSIAASDWQLPDRLTRMCTIPIAAVMGRSWDPTRSLMEARILRPLLWFGLLEHRQEGVEGSRLGRRHYYRKSALFDRFLSFEVALESAPGAHH